MSVPADNPLLARRVDTTSPVEGLWLLESIRDARASIDSDGWVDPAIGMGGAGLATLGMVVDPVGSLVSMGVAWLMEQVRPLSEALDWLAGDPDQIAAHAGTWFNVSARAGACAEQLQAAVQRDVAGWSGQASQAYRRHAREQVAALSGISEAAAGIGRATEGAGQLVAAVRAIVRDLVAECVAILAARVPQWLAMTGATVGVATPWVIAQVANLVATWVARISRFIEGMLASLARLAPLLRHLGDLLAQLRAILARLARHDPTTSHLTDTGAGPPAPRDHRVEPNSTVQAACSSDIAKVINDPNAFEPGSLRGMSPDDVAAAVPDWTRGESNRGGGIVLEDPDHRGRQIRIMPGYPDGNRPNPVTHGPYAVVSQNGQTVKIPLEGNPMLGGQP